MGVDLGACRSRSEGRILGALISPEHFGRKLDTSAVLTESAAMRTNKPENPAFTVLRALFDLAEADVRPNEALVGRLLGLEVDRVLALVARLRVMRLVQPDRLGLTMAGLVLATSLPETELAPTAPASERTSNAA